MKLHLQRTYFSTGTNGVLKLDNEILCYTIELPWRDNRKGLSCIPEGKYRLETRYSSRLKSHLLLEHVPGRTLILLHPANNALTDLKGCIAPVSDLTGPGAGTKSAIAFTKVKNLVYKTILAAENVWLVISSSSGYPSTTTIN